MSQVLQDIFGNIHDVVRSEVRLARIDMAISLAVTD